MIGHPAKFNDKIIHKIAELVPRDSWVLDPFAGTGRIHRLQDERLVPGVVTHGIEIEEPWASMHERTRHGDALYMMQQLEPGVYNVIATSPTYGNRMADHHNAKDGSIRNTYTHKLGRPLHERNSGRLQWGDAYRQFHDEIWEESARILEPGGLVVLNIADHIRKGVVIDVVSWHVNSLVRKGFKATKGGGHLIDTHKNGFGANGDVRVPGEWVIRLERV